MRLRVLIADDHAAMLEWLAAKIREEFDVVAAVRDAKSVLEEAARLDPDIIVLDLAMPPCNGLQLMRTAKESGSRAQFVLISGYSSPELAQAALSAGARGFVAKIRLMDDLLPSIRRAAKAK